MAGAWWLKKLGGGGGGGFVVHIFNVLVAGSVGMRRINTMVTSLMLRRTKEEIQDQIHLTQKFVETHVITLRQEEKDIYDVLFKKAQ